MIKVRNLNGTSDNTPPIGYNSWRDWWEDRKGRKFKNCSCVGCTQPATVGAHVQKAGSANRSWYIVPLCISCNNRPTDEEFDVWECDLEPVN